MPTTQPTLHVSSVSPSLVGGQRTLVVEHGEREGDVTLVSFGGWNFPRRRVVDDHVGTRDGRTPALQLPASKLVERFQPVLGAVQSDECKSGRSQCWCTGSPACASKAVNQCRSCHDFASERSQVVTVCQCSVKLHAKVRRCSLAGQSSTTDVYVKFTFCLSVVQVKRFRHCFGFT